MNGARLPYESGAATTASAVNHPAFAYVVAAFLSVLCLSALPAGGVHAISVSEVGLPTALWETVVVPGGKPTYGLRHALYTGSAVPQYLILEHLYDANTTAPPNMQVQARVTSMEGFVSYNGLFVAPQPCTNISIVRNNALVSVPVADVTSTDFATVAGALVTCNWGGFPTVNYFPSVPPSVSMIVYPPYVFDATDYYDVLVWTASLNTTVWNSVRTCNMPADWTESWSTLWAVVADMESTDYQQVAFANINILHNATSSATDLYWLATLQQKTGYDAGASITLSSVTAPDLTTIASSMCVVGNMEAAYFMERIPAGDAITGTIVGLTSPPAPGCVEGVTYAAPTMMQMCDNDPMCVGFYTTARTLKEESGRCFLYRRALNNSQGVFSPDIDITRLAHWKRQMNFSDGNVGCQVNIADTLDLTIQISAPNVEVAVLVNEQLQLTCQQASAAACGTYNACGTIQGLQAGWAVRVVPTRVNTLDNTCPEADLRVLFRASPSTSVGSANPNTPANGAAITQLKATAASDLSSTTLYRDVVVYSNMSHVYLYVLRATNMKVYVQQSSFASMSSTYAFFVEGDSNIAFCGGGAPYGFNGTTGLTNRCDVWAPCPGPLLQSGEYTGSLRMFFAWDQILAVSQNATWCNDRNLVADPTPSITIRFLAEVTTSPDTPSGWLGTTDPQSGDRVLSPMVYLPISSPSSVNELFSLNTATAFKYLQDSILSLMTVAAYIPRVSYVFTGNELQACGVDVVGASGTVTCAFPINPATTYVSLRVEDGNLADNAVTWAVQDVSSANGTAVTIRSGLCGGTAGYTDGTAATGNCGFLWTCIAFRTDSALYAGKQLRLLVSVPRGIISPQTQCPPFGFLAVVNTTTAPLSTLACSGFQCASTGACVNLNRVCDGVADCGDGTDEESCFDWYPVETESVLNFPVILNTSTAVIPSDFTIDSMKDCRALALCNHSQAIAFNSVTHECVVYNFTSPTSALFDVSFQAVPLMPYYTVYIVLTTPLQYLLCSDQLSCNGRGTSGYTSNGCGCSCFEKYTGAACENYLSIDVDYSRFSIQFVVASGSTQEGSVTTTSAASALKSWMPKGLFTCAGPFRTSSQKLDLICTDASGTAGSGNIGSASAAAQFNRYLGSTMGGLYASALAVTSLPQPETLTACNYFGDYYQCDFPAAVSVGGLAVTTSTSISDKTDTAILKVNLTVRSATRRRSGVTERVVTAACPPESTYHTNVTSVGLALYSCSLADVSNVTDTDPVVSLRVFLVEADGVTPIPIAFSILPPVGPSASMRRSLNIPDLDINAEPKTTSDNFSVWLWAGVALAILGTAVSFIVISLAVIYRQHLKRVLNRTKGDGGMTRLHKVISILYLQLTRVDTDDPLSDDDEEAVMSPVVGFDADATATKEKSLFGTAVMGTNIAVSPMMSNVGVDKLRQSTAFPNMNRRKYAFCCSSFWVLTWLIAIFLLLYYVSSSGITSDTWLVVERYSDSSCEDSAFSSAPSAVFYVTDDSATTCQRRKIAGTVPNSFYFSGYCITNTTSDGVGSAVVRYRSGNTQAECEAADEAEVASGSCLDSEDLWGTNDTSFTRLSCATIASASTRFQYLQTLSSETQPQVYSYVVPLDASLTTLGYNEFGGVTRPMVRKSGRTTVVATTTGHYDTTGMGTTLYPVQGQQLYLQLGNDTGTPELFLPPSEPSYFSPSTFKMESDVQHQLIGYLLDSSPLYSFLDSLPSFTLPELPIGQIYGYMNRSSQLTGAAAGVTSSRYYGARQTTVDIGAFIDTSTMTDGQGFTIAFNLRATPQTYGFAFAVTDAMENQQTGTSPILDLMISMLQQNAGVDGWFDDDYHIYHSLFVNGPSQQLQFIYAYPAQVFGKAEVDANNNTLGKTLGILTWDLESLNLERLLNGLWHNIRVVIRLEANLLKVQLIADGETSRSVLGWNQCLNDNPRPIYDYPAGQGVYIYNNTNKVSAGALLWTGYLNGGVGDLQYMPYVEDIFAIWQLSSPAVQQFNSINTQGYTILGYAMIILGILLFIIMLLTSGKDLYIEAKRAERARLQGVFLRYVGILNAMPGGYQFLKYTTAKRWLGLSDTQFTQFLDEVQNTTSAVPLELHRVLYLAGLALLKNEPRDIDRPLPSRKEWAQLLVDDEAKYILDHTRHFPCYREGLPESDPYRIPNQRGGTSGALGGTSENAVPDGRNEGEEIIAAEMMFTATVRATATFKQEGETGAVNTGNLNFSSGGTAATSQLSMKTDSLPSVGVDLRQLFLPVISVVQEIHLWVTSSELVQEYLNYFQQAFGFISIDFVTSFSLPTLITPIVQLVVGLLAFLLLLYLTSMDQVWFSWYVARYVLKRDTIEMGSTGGADDHEKDASQQNSPQPTPRTNNNTATTDPNAPPVTTATRIPQYVARIMQRFPDPFGKMTEFPVEYEVEVLPLKEAMRLDRFLGISTLGKDDDSAEASEENEREISVKDAKGREFTLTKNTTSDSRKGIDRAPCLGVETTALNTQTCTLDVVGVRCREHKSRRLAPQLQTDIWPFMLAPECCIVTNGVRCGASQGIIYSCQYEKKMTDGTQCYCDYAVCERHYRGGLVDGLTAEVLGVVRTGLGRGPQWIIATVVVLGANAAYMPFVQTAFMILGCHPTYQCEFTDCSFSNQKFLLAGFLACCVIALFGLGVPLMQTVQLHRRRKMLLQVFFADEYNGRYEEKDDDAEEEKTVLEKLQRSAAAEEEEGGDLGASSFRASHHGKGGGTRKRKAPLVKKDSQVNSAVGGGDVDLENTIGTLGSSVMLPFSGIGAEVAADEADEGKEVTQEADGTTVTELVSPVKQRIPSLPPTPRGAVAAPVAAPPAAPAPVVRTSPIPSHSHHSASINDVVPSPDAKRPGSSLAWADDASPKSATVNLGKPPKFDAEADAKTPRGADTAPTPLVAQAAAGGNNGNDDDDDKGSRLVRLSEWSRFLASDPTVLGNLYKPLEFEWIYLSPILLLWKVVIVCPAVFLPASSFAQLVGISAVEVGFAMFIFITAPFTSSMADLMYKAGNCHQVLFLGVRALDTVARYQGGVGYGFAFLLLTFAYLGFSAVCIAWTVLGAQIRKITDRNTSTKALEGLGFQYAPSTSLYVVPSLDGVRRFNRATNADEELQPDDEDQ